MPHALQGTQSAHVLIWQYKQHSKRDHSFHVRRFGAINSLNYFRSHALHSIVGRSSSSGSSSRSDSSRYSYKEDAEDIRHRFMEGKGGGAGLYSCSAAFDI